MKLIHFIHRYPPARGGAESYCERLTKFLQHHGHRVEVWTSTANDLSAMWYQGYAELPSSEEVRRFQPMRFPGRRYVCKALSLIPWSQWQAYWLPCNPICPEMTRHCKTYDEPLDAVHAFAFPYSFLSWCAWRLARRRNVPFWLTPFLHLGDPTNPNDRTRKQYTSRPLRWLLQQADRVFVQTESEFAAVRQLGVTGEKIILQGLGVEPAECTGGKREALRRQWNVTEEECVIGHLANLSREKGSVDLLEAVAGAAPVILAGPEMSNFEAFWKGYPHQESCRKLGTVSDSVKRDFFAAIDLFVLPSRSDSFGLVLLEAWANSLPVVVYQAGGPGELVRDGIDGCVVPCGDRDALRQTILELATNPVLRRQLGQNGQDRLREFQWADKLGIVLQQVELLKRPAGSTG